MGPLSVAVFAKGTKGIYQNTFLLHFLKKKTTKETPWARKGLSPLSHTRVHCSLLLSPDVHHFPTLKVEMKERNQNKHKLKLFLGYTEIVYQKPVFRVKGKAKGKVIFRWHKGSVWVVAPLREVTSE